MMVLVLLNHWRFLDVYLQYMKGAEVKSDLRSEVVYSTYITGFNYLLILESKQ